MFLTVQVEIFLKAVWPTFCVSPVQRQNRRESMKGNKGIRANVNTRTRHWLQGTYVTERGGACLKPF
jgi:hypothetical protein